MKNGTKLESASKPLLYQKKKGFLSKANKSETKPILRWAGGKSWLLKDLHKFIPHKFQNYHEPFIGGASVFLFLQPDGISYLSDSNPRLVNTYLQLKINVEEVIKTLKAFKNTEAEYYAIREARFSSAVKKAAQFIYLNRTGFNGIYRVNLKGKYNVPYGHKRYKLLFDFDLMRRVSRLLERAKLWCGDFESSLDNIKKGDFIFLDPPYTASKINNGFIKYNENLFTWDDQLRLADYIEKIIKKGAFFVLTNAKHRAVKDLFGRFGMPHLVKRSNVVGGKKAQRGTVEEYVFTNSN